MLSLKKTILGLMGSGALLLAAASVAQAGIEISFNVSPPAIPRHYVNIHPPRGYHECYTMRAGWQHGMWIAAHQECRYIGPRGTSVWSKGFWSCSDFDLLGHCRSWKWHPYHWKRERGLVIPHPNTFPFPHAGGMGPGPVQDNAGQMGPGPHQGGGFGPNPPPPQDHAGQMGPGPVQGGGFGSNPPSPLAPSKDNTGGMGPASGGGFGSVSP